MLLSIEKLLIAGRAPDHPVYHDAQATVHWQDFAKRIARLAGYLSAQPQQRWLLASEKAEEFASWLLALLATGKHIVIPPNFQTGTVAQLAAGCTVCATDLANDSEIAALPAVERIPVTGLDQARLELYTSGSTGQSKCVVKTLQQLEREIAVLESLWGKQLGDASVVATVPHHHIYGLLFRLLWPLAAGRPFDTVQCAHPDTLQQRVELLRNTVLVASPAQLARMPQLIALESIAPWPRLVFSSGGPLALETAQAFHAHAGTAPLEVYGSTETGGMAWREQTRDAWWTPLPGIKLNAGAERSVLHSPFLADDTTHALDDALEVEADGRFRLLGRIDRIVKVEEKRLSLPDMENRMQEHPWVSQAAAVLIKGSRQSIGMALTLTDSGQAALAAQGRQGMRSTLREHLAAHFDAVLLPRYWRYLETLPYTPQGKLPLAALQALFEK